MKQLYICLVIFLSLAASRFIPHPPNFTSLIALAFYVPIVFGIRYLPFLILSFAITDLIIGYHTGTHWTWGSVLLVALISQFFTKHVLIRVTGALFGSCIFFLITNFGVWLSGMYGLNLAGLYICYWMAIPFFAYNLISTLMFSSVIELGYFIYKRKIYI